MKKAILLLSLVFILAYAVFLSIGIGCSLTLLGGALAISLDGKSAIQQYPRFFPFCIVLGCLALIAIIILFVFHIKASEKFEFSKKVWCIQLISAFFISLPMIKIQEMLFEYLRNVF